MYEAENVFLGHRDEFLGGNRVDSLLGKEKARVSKRIQGERAEG